MPSDICRDAGQVGVRRTRSGQGERDLGLAGGQTPIDQRRDIGGLLAHVAHQQHRGPHRDGVGHAPPPLVADHHVVGAGRSICVPARGQQRRHSCRDLLPLCPSGRQRVRRGALDRAVGAHRDHRPAVAVRFLRHRPGPFQVLDDTMVHRQVRLERVQHCCVTVRELSLALAPIERVPDHDGGWGGQLDDHLVAEPERVVELAEEVGVDEPVAVGNVAEAQGAGSVAPAAHVRSAGVGGSGGHRPA